MLKGNPTVGERVIGLQDDFWEDGYPIVIQGQEYLIAGYSNLTGNPYYILDGDKIYIDEDAWHLYDLV